TFLLFLGSAYLVEPCPAPIFEALPDQPQAALQTLFGSIRVFCEQHAVCLQGTRQAGLSRRRNQFNPGSPRAYLITLSALASTLGGIVRPICFAVFRLIKNSKFVGCSTGKGHCTARPMMDVPHRDRSTSTPSATGAFASIVPSGLTNDQTIL